MATPHRTVNEFVNGLVEGAKGIGNSLASAVKGAGGTIMAGLDKPFSGVVHKEGPHRIADRLLNGTVDATSSLGNGVIGAGQTLGEGLMKALDQPHEQTGMPPDLGEMKAPKFKLPFGKEA